ncbi:MAG: hypothetical protein J5950_09605 [Clostridia bacterium]|nr:hypothetical protein [Clostridia bacterium]
MSYGYSVSDHHKELINQAIKILNDLNAPISRNVLFRYMKEGSYSTYGMCFDEKNSKKNEYDYKVTLNSHLINDEDFINTVVHELLHTIDNGGVSSHKGDWAKWARIVSNNTKYHITRIGNKRLNLPYAVCFCPLCNNRYDDIPLKSISNHKSSYFCPKCIKPLYDVLPDSEIKEKSPEERSFIIKQKLEVGISWNELFELLSFANKEDTRDLIRYAIRNFDVFLVTTYLFPYVRGDKAFMANLAKDYCNGVYDDIITGPRGFFLESFWALTDYYIEISKHTEALLNQN